MRQETETGTHGGRSSRNIDVTDRIRSGKELGLSTREKDPNLGIRENTFSNRI